jgi:NADPH-dependent curcumin reductase CurA
MSASRQFRLVARPVGEFKASDWDLVEAAVPEAGDGEIVVEATHIRTAQLITTSLTNDGCT